MASPEDCASDAREKIRQLLNRDKIKLWLPPYTTDSVQPGECCSELITKYSIELGLSTDAVSKTVESLRLHALSKLASDNRFRQTGIATIRVKFAGHYPARLSSKGVTLDVPIDTSLSVQAVDLKHRISTESGVGVDCLKLICSGSVLQDNATLESQNIRHNSHVMALCLSTSEADKLRQQEQAARVAKAREAAEFMSTREDDGDHYYMQIANQSGKTLDLPEADRKALMLAMVLHEKGRMALKRREYGEALIFLLEADCEFKKCSASILGSVDNYALVCLDIVWCYLCLKNISSLPDAESRLETCKNCFNKSYGPNLERLANVKGNTGAERALLLRLHLLQGVLAYLQCRNDDARALLSRAELELSMLKTKESDMIHVMEMGFTEIEARLALRACSGHVQSAVARIMQRREEKRQQRQEEKEERRKKRLAKKLGKTADGQLVNVEHYEMLVSMSFPKGAAAAALKQSNNDITLSFQILHEQPHLLDLPDPDPPHFEITDEMLTEVTSMGFDIDMARAALHHCGADIRKAVDELIRLGGVVPPDWLQNLQSTSATSSNVSVSTTSSAMQLLEQQERERELMDEIIPDIPKDEQDYLDLTLDDEAALLCEYLARLSSL